MLSGGCVRLDGSNRPVDLFVKSSQKAILTQNMAQKRLEKIINEKENVDMQIIAIQKKCAVIRTKSSLISFALNSGKATVKSVLDLSAIGMKGNGTDIKITQMGDMRHILLTNKASTYVYDALDGILYQLKGLMQDKIVFGSSVNGNYFAMAGKVKKDKGLVWRTMRIDFSKGDISSTQIYDGNVGVTDIKVGDDGRVLLVTTPTEDGAEKSFYVIEKPGAGPSKQNHTTGQAISVAPQGTMILAWKKMFLVKGNDFSALMENVQSVISMGDGKFFFSYSQTGFDPQTGLASDTGNFGGMTLFTDDRTPIINAYPVGEIVGTLAGNGGVLGINSKGSIFVFSCETGFSKSDKLTELKLFQGLTDRDAICMSPQKVGGFYPVDNSRKGLGIRFFIYDNQEETFASYTIVS